MDTEDLDQFISKFEKMKVVDLKKRAKDMGLSGYSKLKKNDLVKFIGQESVRKSVKKSKKSKSKSPIIPSALVSPLKVQSESSPKSPQTSSQSRAPVVSTTVVRAPVVTVPKKTSSKRYRIMKYVGPTYNPNKYGLIKELGKGNYGTTYKVVNLTPEEEEDEFYALKLVHFDPSIQGEREKIRKSWEKEVRCLDEVYHLCHQIGILCYHESFINGDDFVIVTSLLEGYMSLWDYLFKRKSKKGRDYDFTKDIIEKIYSDIIEVKNALTELCINHSDLHAYNIMIEPKSRDIKVIDFGRCQTPEEEINEWKGSKRDWDLYSDEARIRDLKEFLYMALYGLKNVNTKDQGYLNYVRDLDTRHPVEPFVKGCKRR